MIEETGRFEAESDIIEGAHLEPLDRFTLEQAGRNLFEKGAIQHIIVDTDGAYTVFVGRLDEPVMVYVARDEAGYYRLDRSICSSCVKRPLVPCAHMYAAALAAREAGVE